MSQQRRTVPRSRKLVSRIVAAVVALVLLGAGYWYWSDRNINAAANSGDFVQVTRLINGGTNGLADRQAYYARAQDALY